MYGVAGEKRPIFAESNAFLYNIGDPSSNKLHSVFSGVLAYWRIGVLSVFWVDGIIQLLNPVNNLSTLIESHFLYVRSVDIS
jgi:hypothetical protein